MTLDDRPLLNQPQLMNVVLKAAADGAASPADCLARLKAVFAAAHEAVAADDAELIDLLQGARTHLLAAGALEPAGEDRLRLTSRGRQLLAAHPAGIDDSVLMEFPEFRRFVRRAATPKGDRRVAAAALREKEYDEGHAAFRAGRTAAENPYDQDSAQFLAWENGWFEARDEEVDHGA
jgi:ribosome modulation factor